MSVNVTRQDTVQSSVCIQFWPVPWRYSG